jgi:hypothetical protein
MSERVRAILPTEQSLGVGCFILMLNDICQLNQVNLKASQSIY